MTYQASVGGKVHISCELQYRNKAGEVIGTTRMEGDIPLSRFSPEDQAQLLKDHHGTDDR